MAQFSPLNIPDVTGRDRYIMVQALATAFALIGTLPYECQEASNRHDMAKLLRHMCGEDWMIQAHAARHVLSEAEWSGEKRPLRRDEFSEFAE